MQLFLGPSLSPTWEDLRRGHEGQPTLPRPPPSSTAWPSRSTYVQRSPLTPHHGCIGDGVVHGPWFFCPIPPLPFVYSGFSITVRFVLFCSKQHNRQAVHNQAGHNPWGNSDSLLSVPRGPERV